MRIAPFVASCALVLGTGCGIVSKDLEGNVNFGFEIDDADNHYEDVVEFDPNSNPDVRDNRDKVEEGAVVEIVLSLLDVSPTCAAGQTEGCNAARIVAGQVDVKRKGQPDEAYIQAVGQWAGIPLYDQDGSPARGQRFKLELPLDTQDDLSRIVFEETNPLEFRLNGYGFDDYMQPLGPVRLRGEVDVKLEFTVSAP